MKRPKTNTILVDDTEIHLFMNRDEAARCAVGIDDPKITAHSVFLLDSFDKGWVIKSEPDRACAIRDAYGLIDQEIAAKVIPLVRGKIHFNGRIKSEYDNVFSNFVAVTIRVEDKTYPSVEHAFQAMKSFDPEEREYVRTATNPGQAKRRGHEIKMRPDWEKVKLPIMINLNYRKFYDHFVFEKVLLDTEDNEIIEDATVWNDEEWGIGARGLGKDFLGIALMAVRRHLKRGTMPCDLCLRMN